MSTKMIAPRAGTSKMVDDNHMLENFDSNVTITQSIIDNRIKRVPIRRSNNSEMDSLDNFQLNDAFKLSQTDIQTTNSSPNIMFPETPRRKRELSGSDILDKSPKWTITTTQSISNVAVVATSQDDVLDASASSTTLNKSDTL